MKDATQNFNDNGSEGKLYFTSDELAYFDEQSALDHARQLDDQTIKVKTSKEVDREVEALTNDDFFDDLQSDPFDFE